jgi:hypothetical protein
MNFYEDGHREQEYKHQKRWLEEGKGQEVYLNMHQQQQGYFTTQPNLT